MKLKKYNRRNVLGRLSAYPTLAVSKSGIIRVNSRAMVCFGLTVGSKINIVNDQESPRDWYVELTDEPDGLVLRKSNSALACNSATIAFEMKNIIKDATTVVMRIATEPVPGYPRMYALLNNA